MSIRDWYRRAATGRRSPQPSAAPQAVPQQALMLPPQYYQTVPTVPIQQIPSNNGVPVTQTDALSVGSAMRFYHPTATGVPVASVTAKSLPSGISAARGPRVRFHDPLSLIYATGFRDRRFSLTYDTLRRTSYQLSLLNAIILTRVNQVASFAKPYRKNRQLGFQIRFKDERYVPDEAERIAIERMEQYIMDCGWGPNPYTPFPRDDFEAFIKKFVRDSLTYDQGCFEVVPDDDGRPYEFRAVDAATIRLAATYDGYRGPEPRKFKVGRDFTDKWVKEYGEDFEFDGESVFTVQVMHGRIENIFTHNDLAFCLRNPRSDVWVSGYGFAETEMCLATVLRMLWAEEYNARIFRQGSMANGILNFKGENFDPSQLEAFRRIWQAHVAGVENCLHGDTQIWTIEHGAKSIRDVLSDLNEKRLVLWTGKEWAGGRVFKTSKPKFVCKTTLGNGVEIKTSPDHRFRVIGESGEPEWRRQEDLLEGDFVLVNKKEVSSDFILPSYCGKTITPELMEVLGWYMGDGYIRSSGKTQQLHLFYHHEKEVEVRERHLKVLREFEPLAYSKDVEVSKERQEYIKAYYGFHNVASVRLSIRVLRADFVRWIVDELGFAPSSEGKTLPWWVYNLPSEFKCAFLRGFFSADGSVVCGRSPVITISSDSVREQTRLLLLSEGIRTTASDVKMKVVKVGRDRECERVGVELRIKDRDVFWDKIGFIQDHKQHVVPKTERTCSSSKISPLTVAKYVKEIREKNKREDILDRRTRMNLNSVACGSESCSLPRLLSFLEKAQIEVPSWLNDYHFEPIVSLERTDEMVEMFDVEMFTEEHQFVANGVITHNSHRMPIVQIPEGVEFVSLQRGNKEMEYRAWLDYLLKIVSGTFQIDPAEINFDLVGGAGARSAPLFESKHEWKLKHSRDKGLRPLLEFVAKCINKYVIDPLDSRLYFDFLGLDRITENDRVELNTRKVTSYMTLNEVRQEEGLNPVVGGDIILNPIYLQSIQLPPNVLGGSRVGANPLSPWLTEGEDSPADYGEAVAVPLYMQEGGDEEMASFQVATEQPGMPPPGGPPPGMGGPPPGPGGPPPGMPPGAQPGPGLMGGGGAPPIPPGIG